MAKIRFKSTIHSEHHVEILNLRTTNQINERTVQARIHGPKPIGMVGLDQNREKMGKLGPGWTMTKKKREFWTNSD